MVLIKCTIITILNSNVFEIICPPSLDWVGKTKHISYLSVKLIKIIAVAVAQKSKWSMFNKNKAKQIACHCHSRFWIQPLKSASNYYQHE